MLRTKWADEAYKLSIQGLNATEILPIIQEKFPNEYITIKGLRTSIKRDRKRNGTQRDSQGRPLSQESHKVREVNGTRVYEDLMPYEVGQNVTQDYVMNQKGLSPDEWEVVSFTKNAWQQQNKDGEAITLCQSKLVVRPKKPGEITFADIDNWFDKKDFSKVPKRYYPIKETKSGIVAEITASDIHFGMLAWANECGKDFDLHICKEKFLGVVRDLVDRLKNENLEEVYFCTLGDVLHVDNVQGTTTKGTVQQIDGRISKIIDFAFDSINEALEMVRELQVPIHYVYVSGNHDNAMGYALVRMLQIANNDIDFDVSPNPQKAIHFGKVLVGLNHGDIPKQNKGQWLAHDYRKEYGESEYIEVHSGHVHNEEVKTYNGILERSVLAQTYSSLWERSMGYRSQKGIQCFVWDKELGLRDIKYSIY